MQRLRVLILFPGAFLRTLSDLTARERRFLTEQMAQARGLMPLLMKPRNRQRWTAADRRELRAHLRRLSSICPYLIVLAMPGGTLALPMLAWWLDRRRSRRPAGPVMQG